MELHRLRYAPSDLVNAIEGEHSLIEAVAYTDHSSDQLSQIKGALRNSG